MLLFEHGAEGAHLALAEADASGLESPTEVEREVAVACRDARSRSSSRSESAHDLARNAHDLAVQVDLDQLLSHLCWFYRPEPEPCNLFRGLNAYTLPQPTT